MTKGYGSHPDFMNAVEPEAQQRLKRIEEVLRNAFRNAIIVEQVEVIHFANISALDLANAIQSHPMILKPLLTVCNIAARAIERDLLIRNLDTYSDFIKSDYAKAIAGYIKPFLPPTMPLRSLVEIDRVEFIDKEIRKRKGRWEKNVVEALTRESGKTFVKRPFRIMDEGSKKGQEFELDAAYPNEGPIEVGVDIKRIEARRDIHKRCDEIVNKSIKLAQIYPNAKFGVVIYYPFIDEHTNVADRLRTRTIDSIVFASEDIESIRGAARLLLGKVGFIRS